MKVLSVLFTITLLVSTNRLAGVLRRIHALPDRGDTATTTAAHKYQRN